MNFNNDEDIKRPQNVTGKRPIKAGKTSTKITKNAVAPLEESRFKFMLEIAGAGSTTDRPGVDLVAVVDVSGSMGGEKLEKLQGALIRKLSPIDRLSVVSFSSDFKLICPLRQITDTSRPEIEALVDALADGGSTNIALGLETALKVLQGRRVTVGRVVGIMLMSDGGQTEGDATKVPVGNVPTFGFGVLSAIAHNSREGTFADANNEKNLSKAFSQCLGGLLTVAVQDLDLKLIGLNKSTIQKVSAGSYPQSTDNSTGSNLTVSFGNVYVKEVRTVMVDLLLPKVNARAGADILEISYTYSTEDGDRFLANPITVNITRAGIAAEPEREEVVVEEGRIQTTGMMKEARIMADDKKHGDAVNMLKEAKNLLETMKANRSNPTIKALTVEIERLIELVGSEEVYNAKGRAFAMSSETSHARQRHAARGDDVGEVQMYATARMKDYLGQAEAFEADPAKPLPSAEEDEKKEAAADPVTPVVAAIEYYVQTAIQSLQSLENILNTLNSF